MKANLEKIIKDGLNSDRSKQRNVDHFIFDPKFDILTQNELVGFESKSGKSLHTLRGTISMRKFGNVNRKGRKIELYVLSTDECRFVELSEITNHVFGSLRFTIPEA